MNKVFFHYEQVKLNLAEKKPIKKLIVQIFKTEKLKLKRIDYIFCTDVYLLAINKKFLKQGYLTDTITFKMSDEKDEQIAGEVYISVDRVRENARMYKEKIFTEFLRVLIHSTLHLCSYSDYTSREKLLMHTKEGTYIKLFFNIYSTRTRTIVSRET